MGCAETAKKRTGSALILVLWIIGMLSLILISFSFDAHLEGKLASFSRKKSRAEAFANSGFELAKSYIHRSHVVTGKESSTEIEDDYQYKVANNLRLGKSETVYYPFYNSAGEEIGSVQVSIEPEDLLRNVNKLTEEDWERIFTVMGLPDDYWPDLIDSFYDWTDSDDEARDNGAETTDYYADLNPAMAAANGPLNDIRELLLIKNFTEPILVGGSLNPEDPIERQIVLSNGVERLFTTYGEGKININAIHNDAQGRAILQTLPGVEDEITAGAILEERESALNYMGDDEMVPTAFESVADARTRLADIVSDDGFFNHITTQSKIYRITSIGQADRVTKRIWAIVQFEGDFMRILRWREEP